MVSSVISNLFEMSYLLILWFSCKVDGGRRTLHYLSLILFLCTEYMEVSMRGKILETGQEKCDLLSEK